MIIPKEEVGKLETPQLTVLLGFIRFPPSSYKNKKRMGRGLETHIEITVINLVNRSPNSKLQKWAIERVFYEKNN